MRILQLCFRVPYPPHDGGAIAMYNMAKGFHEHGCELTMLSFNTVKHYVDPETLPTDFKKLGDFYTVPLDASVRPLDAFLNLFSKESYNISRFDIDDFHQKLKELLQKNEYDIIHFEGLFVSMYVDTARKYAPKSKLVLRQHNVEHLIWARLADDSRFPKKQYLNLLTKRLKEYELATLPKFDAIVPITDIDEKHFKDWGVSESFVSSTGVDTNLFKPDFSQNEPLTVYHLGSLNWLPNQKAVTWFVEEVWEEVLKEVPNAQFFIAGKDIPEWVYEYNQIPNVKVIGEVPSAIDFMNSKSIMVVPLKSGSGMRIKIVEGMSLGKPIITTSIGAEGIKCTHKKNILIADTQQEFVRELVTLLNDRAKQEKIGTEANFLIQDCYSNTAKTAELLAYYQKLIEK
ncbi:MAG: glycosyltransferase [Cytophagales bacterium]|nr:glycosyltransferase [Cytophagales bacterium]